MAITSIQKQFNYFINKHPGYIQTQSYIQPQSSIVSKEPENKKSNNNKLYLGLGGLALIVIAGLIYKKFHKLKTITKNSLETKANSQTIISDGAFSVQKYIDNFSKNMSNVEKYKFDEKLKIISLTKFKLINYLQEGTLTFLRYLLAAKKAELHKFIQLPKIFLLNNDLQPKIKDTAKILSTILEFNFASTKYTRGHLKEFVESLNEFSINSLKKYNEEHSHTLLQFDNASEFFKDLNNKGNEEYKLVFDNLTKKNTENKITYIVDKDASKQINSDSMITLNFDEKFNAANLAEDLDECEFQLGHNLISRTKDINDELSQYIQPNPNLFYMLRNLMLDKPTENVFLIEGSNKEVVNNVINLISSKTGNIFEKIDCSTSLENLMTVILQKGEQVEELYNRTGKRTFLYLDNIEQVLTSNADKNPNSYNELKEFIKNSNEKYHAIIVTDTKTYDTELNGLISENNKLFKIKLFEEKLVQNYLDSMLENMTKNDFSHIDKKSFINGFVNLLAAERAGKPGSTEQIVNGLMLYGPSDITQITANAIKNSVDANYAKIVFNKNAPLDSITEMVNNAEKAEKLFKQTGRRTILEFDNLDELLINKDDSQGIEMIGRFKGFIEHISRDYHTTVLMRTSRSLDDFESASIAAHRFGLKLRNN